MKEKAGVDFKVIEMDKDNNPVQLFGTPDIHAQHQGMHDSWPKWSQDIVN